MPKFDFLTIHKEKTPITFLLAWHAAREHYVMARVSFQQGMTYPSCLLAEQSIEMYVKAILQLDHKSKNTHDLQKLLALGKGKVSYFDKILSDAKLLYFVQTLTESYLTMRFGEVGYSITGNELVEILDEVTFNLDKSYREIIKRKGACPLYVPDGIRETFLHQNKCFGEKDITNDFMAKMPL